MGLFLIYSPAISTYSQFFPRSPPWHPANQLPHFWLALRWPWPVLHPVMEVSATDFYKTTKTSIMDLTTPTLCRPLPLPTPTLTHVKLQSVEQSLCLVQRLKSSLLVSRLGCRGNQVFYATLWLWKISDLYIILYH